MNILIVNSSAQGTRSVSNGLTRYLAERARAADPSARITIRDVGAEPVPHLTAATVDGVRAEAHSEAELQASALADTLIGELQRADLIVIGAPMYNFGIASTLKSWFDHVLRPRVTFRYSEAGPEGLLKGKKAIVIETRAGVYSEGPASAADHQEPHLRTMLGFVGIDDVSFVRVEGAAFGPEAAEKAIAGAQAALDAFVPPVEALAA